MRILVVEDDAPLASILMRTLREESYAVDHAADGQEAEWLAFENPYDLIILDLMLPRKNGLEVLKTLRDGGMVAPVLILTARDTKEDVVKGLDRGADDYLTKPFNLDELLARVRALLRRQSGEPATIIEAGPLRIDPSRKDVTREGQLSEHVWDMNFEPTSNVVDVYIGYLRNKVDKPFDQPLIKTVRGHGYMLDLPAADQQVAANKAVANGNHQLSREQPTHVS